MTIAVDLGRKATKKTNKQKNIHIYYIPEILEQSIQWLLRTRPDKIWDERKEAEKEEEEKRIILIIRNRAKKNKFPHFVWET